MKLHFILLAAAMISAPKVCARLTAADALRAAPFEITAPVSGETLGELLKFAAAGITSHEEPNMMNGDCGITLLESDRAAITTGAGRSLELYLLPAAKNDTVIAMIETLETSAGPDSRVTVYDRSWRPMPKLWREPDSDRWLTPEGQKHRADFESAVPFMLVACRFDPDNATLTLTNRTDAMLSAEQRRASRGFMRAELRFHWTPKGFKPEKN